MTKKDIIAKLKQAKIATIGFNGLVTTASVDNARQALIDRFTAQLDDHNNDNDKRDDIANITMTVSNKYIKFSNGQSIFLPKYPITGKVSVRSKDYIIGGCYCEFFDIATNTYTDSNDTWGFTTKAGNTISVNK